MYLLRVIFLCALVKLSTCNLVVETKFGFIRGKWLRTARNVRIASFLGLPYAEPPTGNLRFENPQPWTKNWTDVRDATSDGSMCPQIERNVIGDEDCLFLNVFRPMKSGYQDSLSNSKIPVLVFIHGGSFTIGSSNSSLLAPAYLLEEEIILVTLNYRLNVLGFFSTGNNVAPGNYGLKDIVAALRWIQDNIEIFGGDPNSVTLCGLSSGSASAQFLAFTNKTEGLFHKLITMSGHATSPWAFAPRKTAREISITVAESVECLRANTSRIDPDKISAENESENRTQNCRLTDREIVDCMKSLDFRKIVQLGYFCTDSECNFRPTLEAESEEAVVTMHPLVVAREGLFRDIPWLTGVTSDEGLFATAGLMENKKEQNKLILDFENIAASFLDRGDGINNKSALAESIINFYFNGNISEYFMSNVTQLVSDALFHWPVVQSLTLQTPNMDSKVFFYVFSYEGTFSSTFKGSLMHRYGVSHTDELNYLFPYYNTLHADLLLYNTMSDRTMINVMSEMWASFVQTGVPSARMTTVWEAYQTHHRFMRLGSGNLPSRSMEAYFMADRITFWQELTNDYLMPILEIQAPSEEKEEDAIYSTDVTGADDYSCAKSSTVATMLFMTFTLCLATLLSLF